MHLILLSGGSGKRLWPLSNDIRSKQFLKVLKDDKGQPESMVQRVYRQLQQVGGWQSITIAASASQKDQLELQLGKAINIVIEPERRDTFPAIALACTYLYDKYGVKRDETIVVLPVDPFVELGFFKCIAQIQSVMNRSDANLVLIGATPIFPSEKYGYILPEVENNQEEEIRKNRFYINSKRVLSFKEKPSAQMAQKLMEEGALWNCGVFGLRLEYVLDILAQKYHVNNFTFEAMKDTFKTLKKTSFDYEVVEKADNIEVIEYYGQWKDLGTWETLTEEMGSALMGNVIHDENCQNTHIINEKDVPVAVMGIKDAVVVASNDGILVANKGQTYKVKDLLAGIETRPMFEEKRWGSYVVIEHTKFENGDEALTKKLSLRAGQQISYQYHRHRKEIWNIIRGTGLLYHEGQKKEVRNGDVVSLKENEKHAILAITDLEIIEVQLGSPLIEEDIIRLEYDWK